MEYPELKTVEEVKLFLTSQLDSIDDSYFGEDELTEEFELEEEGSWQLGGKYMYCTDIWKHEPTDTYWQIDNSRSGSYHTDYYYNKASFKQVQKTERVVTRTITEWVSV